MAVLQLKMSCEHTLHSYQTARIPLLLCLLSWWVGPSLPLQMQSSGCWAVRLPVWASVSLAGRPTVHSNLVTVTGFEYISGNNIVLRNLRFLYFIPYLGTGQVSKHCIISTWLAGVSNTKIQTPNCYNLTLYSEQCFFVCSELKIIAYKTKINKVCSYWKFIPKHRKSWYRVPLISWG